LVSHWWASEITSRVPSSHWAFSITVTHANPLVPAQAADKGQNRGFQHDLDAAAQDLGDQVAGSDPLHELAEF
jgi:hypothetical protein